MQDFLHKIIQVVKEETKFFKSFSYLSLVEVLNIVFPLLIVPLIIGKVGMEGYGKSGLVQSIMLILCVITDWGFNITAIRDISNLKHDKKAQSSLISIVFSTKFWLLLLIIFLFTTVVLLVGNQDFKLYLGGLTLLIGKTIAPNWFFSATERNGFNVLNAFFNNLFYLFFLILFLKNENDSWLIVFFQGISYCISSFLLLFFMIKKFHINLKIKMKDFKHIFLLLNEGKHIFFSNIALQTSAYASTIILSFFITPSLLGIFTLAQKLTSVVKVMLTVFFSTMHQRVCNLISDGTYDKVKLLVKRLYFPFVALFVFVLILISIFASNILSLFTSDVSELTIYVFRISLLTPFVTMFNIVPYLLLLAHNLKKEYSSVTIPSAIFLIILLWVLVPKFQVNGAILALVINELFVVFYLFYKLFNSSIIKYYINGTQ